MKKYLIIIISLISISSQAQEINEVDYPLFHKSIDKQKTANTHDLLTNYFKAGIDNLLGAKHEFNFSGTFLGLDSALKTKFFTNNTFWAKKNSLNILLKGDTSNNIIKFGIGFTFTLLDKRDVRDKEISDIDKASLISSLESFRKNITKYLNDYLSANITDDSKAGRIKSSFNEASRAHNYSLLSKEAKEVLAQIAKLYPSQEINDVIAGRDYVHATYVRIAAQYAQKPLWTLAPTINYDKANKQGTYSLASNFVCGLTKDFTKTPWELEAKALYKIEKDSLNLNTNYDSQPLSVSVGFNKVLLANEDKESKMEFKLFIQHDWQLGKIYNDEDKKLTFNSTLRIKIAESVWLPITLSYDTRNANFLGLFSVTANIGQ